MAGSPVSTSVLLGGRGFFVRSSCSCTNHSAYARRPGIYGVLPHLLPNKAHIFSLSVFAPPEWLRRWRWPKESDRIGKVLVSLRHLTQRDLLQVTKRSRHLTVSRRLPSSGLGLRVIVSSGDRNGAGSRVSGLRASVLQLETRATEVFMVMAVFHNW